MEWIATVQNILTKQLNLELQAATQMAYFSGMAEVPSLKESFFRFAHDELRHFASVAGILDELNCDVVVEPIESRLETDPVVVLVILKSIEDTVIHNYEDILFTGAGMSENLKSKLKANLEEERGHLEAMERLLEEYIESKR